MASEEPRRPNVARLTRIMQGMNLEARIARGGVDADRARAELAKIGDINLEGRLSALLAPDIPPHIGAGVEQYVRDLPSAAVEAVGLGIYPPPEALGLEQLPRPLSPSGAPPSEFPNPTEETIRAAHAVRAAQAGGGAQAGGSLETPVAPARTAVETFFGFTNRYANQIRLAGTIATNPLARYAAGVAVAGGALLFTRPSQWFQGSESPGIIQSQGEAPSVPSVSIDKPDKPDKPDKSIPKLAVSIPLMGAVGAGLAAVAVPPAVATTGYFTELYTQWKTQPSWERALVAAGINGGVELTLDDNIKQGILGAGAGGASTYLTDVVVPIYFSQYKPVASGIFSAAIQTAVSKRSPLYLFLLQSGADWSARQLYPPVIKVTP